MMGRKAVAEGELATLNSSSSAVHKASHAEHSAHVIATSHYVAPDTADVAPSGSDQTRQATEVEPGPACAAAAGSMVSGAPAAPAAVGRGKDTSVRVTAVAAAAGGKGAETPATAPDLAMAWQRNGKGGSGCPPGCIDFGWLGPVLGLPVSCFCNPWLVGKVAERVDKVCVQLSVSVAGGIFMLIGFMGLLMLLSAQSARLQLVGQYPLLYGQKYNTRPGTATAAVAADGGVMVVP